MRADCGYGSINWGNNECIGHVTDQMKHESASRMQQYIGSAEKVIFSEYFRNGGKKVAYFRGLTKNKFLSAPV